jgi:hypothetical protein
MTKRPRFPDGIILNSECENGVPHRRMIPFYVSIVLMMGAYVWMVLKCVRVL